MMFVELKLEQALRTPEGQAGSREFLAHYHAIERPEAAEQAILWLLRGEARFIDQLHAEGRMVNELTLSKALLQLTNAAKFLADTNSGRLDPRVIDRAIELLRKAAYE